jgi:hypothetical protein
MFQNTFDTGLNDSVLRDTVTYDRGNLSGIQGAIPAIPDGDLLAGGSGLLVLPVSLNTGGPSCRS